MITRRELLGSAAASTLGASVAAAAGAPRRSSPAGPITPYRAACVQSRVEPTLGPSGFDAPALARNLGRCAGLIARGADELGARLFVFSEFCLQLAIREASVDAWLASAIAIPGPETERIGRAAQAARAYVAFNAVERIAAFPGRYFLSGVLVGPSGDVLLNYRKLYDLSNKTRPSDFLETWLAHFGRESLFPVAETEIGRIGCAVALDVNWPELVRGLAFNGAEIVVNPTASPLAAPGYSVADPESSLDIRTQVRRVRAFENLVYVLTCNLGPVGADPGTPLTPMLPSEIVDFRGRALAAAHDASEGFIVATLDLEALRRARCSADALNGLAQLQTTLHAPGYAAARFAHVDGFEKHPIRERAEQIALMRADIHSLVQRGVLRAPAGNGS